MIDAAFKRDIVERFSAILTDVDEVRTRLESVLTTHPFDWFSNPVVRREVEKMAQAKYIQFGSQMVLLKIEKMDADLAKEYLKRLIQDNMNVGIEIISEGGSEA